MLMYKIVGGDGKQYGPVTAEEVRSWIAGGRLNGKSMAWLEGTTEWKPLESFPEFSEVLRANASPPPMPGFAGQPAHPADLAAWQSEVLARHAEIRLGACFSRSWKLLTENFGLLLGAAAIIWLIQSVCERIPIIGPLGFVLFEGALYGGLYLVFLRRIRGQNTSISDVFCGFQLAFVQLMLAGFVSKLLSSVAACCFLLPMIYLVVAWVFAVPLVADKRMEFWSAMEFSRKIVTRVWLEMFVLLIAFAIPVVVVNLVIGAQAMVALAPTLQNIMQSNNPPDMGHLIELMKNVATVSIPLWLLSKVVTLLVMPLAVGARMYAYEDLFGPRKATTA